MKGRERRTKLGVYRKRGITVKMGGGERNEEGTEREGKKDGIRS